MLSSNKSLSLFNRSLWGAITVFIIFTLTFVLYVRSEKAIDKANEQRYASHQIADELRQSSDDLTRMVRTYILTGDPIYKQHYHEILDIRDGLKPRPLHYENIYWDLVLSDDKRPCSAGKPISLLTMMRKLGFTPQEFTLLSEAKSNSDQLTKIEFNAINIVESTTPTTDENRHKAFKILHDALYHQAKYAIMKPINDAHMLMDRRTLEAVHNAEKIALMMRLIFIFVGFVLIWTLWRMRQTLYFTLGCSLQLLHSHIIRIGSGDFSSKIQINKGMENSILAWLYETQIKLSKLEEVFLDEQKKAQHYLDIVGVIILVLDVDKNVKLINKYGCEIIGYTADEVIGKNWIENFIPEKCRQSVYEVGDSLAKPDKTRISTFENLVITKSGEERLILWRNTTLFNDNGEYIGILTSGEDITERRKSENALIESEQRLDSIIKTEPECVKVVDSRGKLVQMNPAGLSMLEAKTLEEAQQYSLTDYLLPEYRAGFMALHHKVMGGESGIYAFEVTGLNGSRRWLETHATPMRNTKGEITSLLGVTRDITQQKFDESTLILQTQAMEQSPNSIIITDFKANIEYVNTAFMNNSGYSRSEVIGKNPRFLKSGNTPEHAYDSMWSALARQEKWQGEFINKRKDGTNYIYSINVAPVLNKEGQTTHYIAIEEDISEQKKTQEKIHYLANFDSLTGLPNRIQMDDHLRYTMSLTKRNEGIFALMFLDLDHFKDINDTLGHSAGDLLLVQVAERLSATLREEDTVSRMGGDEFILLLPSSDANGAAQVAQKLLDSICRPILLEGHELSISASIGIALYPADGSDIETLSKNADAAMYRAKQEGRNMYCFFTEEMQKYSQRKLKLVNALHSVLERNELYVVYQPQISASGNYIIGAESLLRWEHPELGSVSPSEFIPIAEENGMILAIGEWVLRTVIKQAKHWMDIGYLPMIMAVNLSAVQFRHPNLPDLITSILEEVALPPEYLELELTEGIAMHNPQAAITIMNSLHDVGIRMSIDDFGTGYSSLAYLKKFKVYKLKIDQSFVRDISTDPEDKAIVSAVIHMARSLGLQTIAEGVETIAQLEYLQEQGCDEIQGYYYSKPLLPEEFEEFMRERNADKDHRFKRQP